MSKKFIAALHEISERCSVVGCLTAFQHLLTNVKRFARSGRNVINV
jgi:hypothetical protein